MAIWLPVPLTIGAECCHRRKDLPNILIHAEIKGIFVTPWKSDRKNSSRLLNGSGLRCRRLSSRFPFSTVLAIFVCYLISAARRGPVEGFYAVAGVIASGDRRDLPATSLRRIMAITRLTIKEAIRRKVLVGFRHLRACLSVRRLVPGRQERRPGPPLPEFRADHDQLSGDRAGAVPGDGQPAGDIKSKTIYTIVTKPVRAGEIVLGRMLGFVLRHYRLADRHVLDQLHVRANAAWTTSMPSMPDERGANRRRRRKANRRPAGKARQRCSRITATRGR